jgi:hypothetical protein
MRTLSPRETAAAAALLLVAAGCAPPHPATITPAGQGPDVQHMPEEALAAPVDELPARTRLPPPLRPATSTPWRGQPARRCRSSVPR